MSRYKEPKAFSVLEDSENTGGIVFAKTSIEARVQGANLYNGGEFNGLVVRRAHWADAYASIGRVPIRVAVEQGWWFECYGCDTLIREEELEERGIDPRGCIGTIDGLHWCSRKCCQRYFRFQRRKQEEVDRVYNALVERVRSRYPALAPHPLHSGLSRSHVDIRVRNRVFYVELAKVLFDWPGQRFGAVTVVYRNAEAERHGPRKLEVFVPQGDAERFQEWCDGARAN